MFHHQLNINYDMLFYFLYYLVIYHIILNKKCIFLNIIQKRYDLNTGYKIFTQYYVILYLIYKINKKLIECILFFNIKYLFKIKTALHPNIYYVKKYEKFHPFNNIHK